MTTTNEMAVGGSAKFSFYLGRELRSGTGIIVADHEEFCNGPVWRIRVTESPTYRAGEVVTVARWRCAAA